MNTINKYLLLFTVLVLSACSVSKDVKTPQAALPAAFRNSTSADTTSIADIPWKNFFTDAELQKLIDSAIVRNYDMQIALKNIQSAQLVLGQSKLGYWPDLSLNVTYNHTRPSDNSLNGAFVPQISGHKYVEDYNANVSLSWEADIWGKVANQKSKALAEYLQSYEARKAVQSRVHQHSLWPSWSS